MKQNLLFRQKSGIDCRVKLLRANSRHGVAFTLMELMTVLAIIAVLFIIIAPRIQNARLRAAATNCRSNIRQYGIALNQLLEASDGYVIQFWAPPSAVFINADGSSYQLAAITNYVVPIPNPLGGQGRIVTDKGEIEPGQIQPEDPGMPPARAWIGSLVFPYIYQMTNSFDGVVWWRDTSGRPQTIPFYNGGGLAKDKILVPENWPTYCPSTVDKLYVFTTRRPLGLNTVPNNELWAVNNPKGFKGFGTDENGFPDPDMGRYTTYAINAERVSQHRGQIPGNVIAFSDWNFIYGFWASVYSGPAAWGFNNARMGAISGVGKQAGRLGSFSEIGFHHPGGNEMAANALLFNGTVVTILSNQAASNMYWQ